MIFSVTIVFVSITKSDVSREFIPHETSILLAKKKKIHVNLLFKIYNYFFVSCIFAYIPPNRSV